MFIGTTVVGSDKGDGRGGVRASVHGEPHEASDELLIVLTTVDEIWVILID